MIYILLLIGSLISAGIGVFAFELSAVQLVIFAAMFIFFFLGGYLSGLKGIKQ